MKRKSIKNRELRLYLDILKRRDMLGVRYPKRKYPFSEILWWVMKCNTREAIDNRRGIYHKEYYGK